MLKLRANIKIYINKEPTDMRKSINGLTTLILEEFKCKTTQEFLFIFFGRSKDKVKIIFWDVNGFVIYYKRLEQGKFKITQDHTINEITEQQLSWLLAGLDYNLMHKFPELDYSNYS